MVKKYHYSNTLPRLNKHFVGFFLNGELVGCVTLGWGTRPLHTIRKIFPSLETKDYYEIGRMCMTDEMPRNSESQMLSQLASWIKRNCPDIKVLFTWADGVRGKPGYVYQASNFYYLGYIWTDTYMKDGVQLHPRQTRAFFSHGEDDKRITCRPTAQQMRELNVLRYKGKQFKYCLFLCGRKERKRLIAESIDPISRNFPKHSDLQWKTKNAAGKWEPCGKPEYKTDIDTQTRRLFDETEVKR